MQKKFWTIVLTLCTTAENISYLLCLQIISTSSFKFVLLPLFLAWLQTIENRHCVGFHVNKLVRENDSFCPGKSGKSQGKWILQSSRNYAVIWALLYMEMRDLGAWIFNLQPKLLVANCRCHQANRNKDRFCLFPNYSRLLCSFFCTNFDFYFHQSKAKKKGLDS